MRLYPLDSARNRSFPPYGPGLAGTLTPRDGTRAVKVFGKWPEAAALVSITIGDEDHATTTEGIWHFVFNDDDHIAKLSILWDTKSLLL
jgi:hypothetical protein